MKMRVPLAWRTDLRARSSAPFWLRSARSCGQSS